MSLDSPRSSSTSSVGEIQSFLYSALYPHRWHLFAAFLVMLWASFSLLWGGAGLKLLIDQGFNGTSIELGYVLTILGFFIVLFAGANYARLYILAWITENIINTLRQRLFSHLISLDLSSFEMIGAGEVSARMTGDLMLVQTLIGFALPLAFRNLTLVLGGTLLLLWTSPFLTLFLAITASLVWIPLLFYGRRVRHISKESQRATARISQFVEETFSDIASIHIFSGHAGLLTRFHGLARELMRIAHVRIRARATLSALAVLVFFSALGGLIFLGGEEITNGSLTAGDLTAFIFYAATVAGALGSLTEGYADFRQALGAIDRFLSLFAHKPQITMPSSPLKLAHLVEGGVSFDNITFSYPAWPDIPIFKNFSLEIKARENVAFIGASGAGKTTLFHLLMRLYDPQDGHIFLDGLPLHKLDLNDLRRMVALVPQRPLLIDGTVFDNVAFGMEGLTDNRVVEALERAHIWQFIQQLPQGLKTPLGTRGVRLSGGQKQRLILARALARRPRLLLLDEATSELDAESEFLIRRALRDVMRDCTTLLITHRLATLRDVDRIIVMEPGRAPVSGTHRELLVKSTLYKRFIELHYFGEA